VSLSGTRTVHPAARTGVAGSHKLFGVAVASPWSDGRPFDKLRAGSRLSSRAQLGKHDATSDLFQPHLILEGLTSPYHSRLCAIHQHFRRPAARVVVRCENRSVRAHVENRQEITLAGQWKLSVARKEVASLADRADYV